MNGFYTVYAYNCATKERNGFWVLSPKLEDAIHLAKHLRQPINQRNVYVDITVFTNQTKETVWDGNKDD